MMPSKDDLRRALAGYRDLRLAELLTVTLGLAVEQHPDEVRAALAQVFDLSAVDYQCRRVSGMLVELLQQLADARGELNELHAKCERLTKQLEGYDHERELRQANGVAKAANGPPSGIAGDGAHRPHPGRA